MEERHGASEGGDSGRLKMKIPGSFQLLGKSYSVRIIPEREWTESETWGVCSPEKRQIIIKGGLSRETTEHVYLHEVTHAILDAMGRDRLYADESFVDLLSGLFHQALTSGK